MGNSKGNGRQHGPDRRRGAKAQRRLDFLRIESLEDRTLLSTTPWVPTTTNLADVQNGPMANAGQDLIGVYQAFQSTGGNMATVGQQFPLLTFRGNMVGVDVNGVGDFNSFLTGLKNAGMQVTASSATYATAEGYLPIAQLPTVAGSPLTLSLHPSYKAFTRFVGVADNQAEQSLFADSARTQFGVDGTGYTIGVLSDSVNQAANLNGQPSGLAGSVATGDLPATPPVSVLNDGPAGSTDEGRAMLENIHDIAPGAGLAFDTGLGGDLTFAQHIQALASQGSKILVDDIGYPDEPFFQDGLIAQAVNGVVASGVTYFSAAGNAGNGGFLAPFQSARDIIPAIGSGTFMNFDSSGATTTTQLPITTTAANVPIVFQFDQPFKTQEPAGSTAAVTSQLNFFVLNATTGAVVASGVTNNTATQQPLQVVTVPTAGSYKVAIQLVSGPAPGHIEFLDPDKNSLTVNLNVTPPPGTSSAVSFPSTYGHAAAASTIGVGAVPWWATAPFLNQSPLQSEQFSSFGPALSVFNPDGTPKSAPVSVQAPVITAPDGGNTSFYGQVIDTSKPPLPGQPATPTNLSQPGLPSFFGTSSSAPNAAAVAALMLQRNPSLTPAGIRGAMIASAGPIDGTPGGVYNVQGGFGLLNATRALSSVDVLRVSSVTPAANQTLTTPPSSIIVTFNKPIDITSINASDIVFTGGPPGVTASVFGAPIGLDSQTTPTQVAFPITINAPAGTLANGTYSFTVQGNIRTATGGLVLANPFPVTFNIADTIAPKVTNVTVNGRIITVQFNEPMRPSTINAGNIILFRAGGVNNGFVNAINLNNDPRVTVAYNPLTFTATLDYSALDQSELPTDNYELVILAGQNGIPIPPGSPPGPGVTDLVGNYLDGEFNGVFPSGDGDPTSLANPSGRNVDERFIENFGVQTLIAPVVSSLVLTPASDSGIKGDENTNTNQPTFVGQVNANFPGTISGLTIYAEFNGLHGGNIDLAPGGGGRGFVGSFDVQTTTDANGGFTLQAPFLPEGYNQVRIVVVGPPDAPPLPGLSSSFDHAFRIDRTAPDILQATLTPGAIALPVSGTNLSSFSTLSLDVRDVSNPMTGALATPAPILFPALDPATANNTSNYSLFNTSTNTDESQFINSATFVATAADFISPVNRTDPSVPYFGRVDLTINPGLPKGGYVLTAHTAESVNGVNYGGLRDAAANPLDNTQDTGSVDFTVGFTLQPEATFITALQMENGYSTDNSTVVGGPRSYYEIPAAGQTPRANAPPTAFVIDFSNPLDPATVNQDSLQLLQTANTPGGTPDGDFGMLGVNGEASNNDVNYSRVPGTVVTLADKTTGALQGQPGFTNGDRLILTLAPGTALTPDHYRLYIPNSGATTLSDIYGNQLDGEFLGNPTSTGGYEDLLPNGTPRAGLSGDAVPGGAFTTAFIVVPNGNIIYARPDYVENPLLPSTAPDGSIAKPYPALAPEALTTTPNPTNDPNGGANSTSFFFNFNPVLDRNGNGHFDRSALYAAQVLSARGPVVVVALPAATQRNPVTGLNTQQTFVLQSPSGIDPATNLPRDGSASVPFDTDLVFTAGSTVKLQNASIFVQNQGSSIQVLGGANPNVRVTFTSYADDSVAGDTNRDATNTVPRAGDWGGIVLRNYDNTVAGRSQTFPIDGTLQGFNGANAASGADDSLSIINFANLSYAGGAVPQTIGTRYDGITLYNSRPAITNDVISFTGTLSAAGLATSSQAAISGDLDSFREDDTARGPLVRRVTMSKNSINGILVRADLSGQVEQTDAINYPDNPLTLGGARNFTFDDPLPYVLLARLDIGVENLTNAPGRTTSVRSRLYVQPGMEVKLQRGAGIEIVDAGSSLNVGDRTYLNRWDAGATLDPTTGLPVSTYGPGDPNFKPETVGDARVIFTSLFDNNATTTFFDPLTQLNTTIVPPIDSANSGGLNQPTPTNVPDLARWGSLSIESGAVGVIDEADFQYGGGTLNVAGGTISRRVLAFIGASAGPGNAVIGPGGGFFRGGADLISTAGPINRYQAAPGFGTRVMITNDNFFNNVDAPMSIEPDGLLAADPLRPLSSGNPFFRGNVLQRNDVNALLVDAQNPAVFPVVASANLDVNSIWDDTDITYLLRNSIVPNNAPLDFTPTLPAPIPPAVATPPPPLTVEKPPFLTLTLQSALPNTLLANGQSIARPGESLIVKLGTSNNNNPAPAVNAGNPDPGNSGNRSGAGFLFGVDDGVINTNPDGPIDQGYLSQLRILGIGGNETTGQSRVPVVITSIHDSTVGATVRGVPQNQVITNDPTAPAAGDGGVIFIGGNTLPDYNLLDPRDGSLIDNADIRYIARIELQGGSNVETGGAALSGVIGILNPQVLKGGAFPALNTGLPDPNDFFIQDNAPAGVTISGSNLTNFRDVGVLGIPGGTGGLLNIDGVSTSGIRAEPLQAFLVNNTITNAPIGTQMYGDQEGAPENTADPFELLALNNTFYNDATSVILGPTGSANRAHIHGVLMDNIFANSATAAIAVTGNIVGSLGEYNLFSNNGADTTGGFPNFQPINNTTNAPIFRDPTHGNFQLDPNSPAIDAARSELDLNPTSQGAEVGALVPLVNQALDATGGVRNGNSRIPDSFGTFFFGFGSGFVTGKSVLTLPGYPQRGFIDEFIPVLTTDPTGVGGPASNAATFNFKPLNVGGTSGGERDQLGFLRQDDPAVPNVGFGSRPFFDIGAYEFRQFFAPHVTSVSAVITDPTSPTGVRTVNIYSVNGVAGTNQVPQTIQFQLDHTLDPATVNNLTVLLQASGGDGIFGNGNSVLDTFIPLSGKVSFDSTTNILTVNLANQGLVLPPDEYRITLQGTGSNVIRDTQGNALDGQNTPNDNPNGAQQPLPSGTGFPGSNFYLTFSINTQIPAPVANTFTLSPASDTNIVGDRITTNNMPSFVGSITAAFPPLNANQGDTVILDISTSGDGNFDRPNAGTATTNAQGNFVVTVGVDGANTGLVTNTAPLTDSPYQVGPDGLLNGGGGLLSPDTDDFGYSIARIRIIDKNGNVSSTSNPFAYSTFVVDTRGPQITGFTPSPTELLRPDASGKIPFTFTVNKNLDPKTVNANSIVVLRAGSSGVFPSPTNVAVPIDPGSIVITPLGGGGQGPEQVTFTISAALTNDLYSVTVLGTGPNAITDIAGNPLNGLNGTGGTNFNPIFTLFSPIFAHQIYVGNASFVTNASATQGTRANPFPTITAGINAAVQGDVVSVLPGVYNEQVKLKALVRVLSVDPTSSDSQFVPGFAQNTVIRAPFNTAATGTTTGTTTGTSTGISTGVVGPTVLATNLLSGPSGIGTEISGFTISSPLLGDPAQGTIDPTSIGILVTNSQVLIDKDFVVDSNFGIAVETSGTNASAPLIEDDGLIGNVAGVLINDINTNSLTSLIDITNNTFAFNTFGLLASVVPDSPQMAIVANNIFWENHDQTPQRNGAAISAGAPNKLFVRNNLFSGNGPSEVSPTDDTMNVGNGFDPNALGPVPDIQGNYTGNPAFVQPRDPRPGSDGPASFFIDADFELSNLSAAIDTANNAQAPPLDFLYRTRVKIPGRGFPGTGPADVGAFEFGGQNGIPAGGVFRVVTTSLAGSSARANGQTVSSAPATIVVNFSHDLNPSSVSPTDLVLSGSGVQGGITHAASLSWIDPHTVQFNLNNGFNASGAVNVSIPNGTIKDTSNTTVSGFSDSITLSPTAKATTPTTTTPVATTPTTKTPVATTPTTKTPVATTPTTTTPITFTPTVPLPQTGGQTPTPTLPYIPPAAPSPHKNGKTPVAHPVVHKPIVHKAPIVKVHPAPHVVHKPAAAVKARVHPTFVHRFATKGKK